jgi:hypothetical protein
MASSESQQTASRLIRRLRELASAGVFVAIDDTVGPPGSVVLRNH